MTLASNAESESLYMAGMEQLNKKNYAEAESSFKKAFELSEKDRPGEGKRQQSLRVLFGLVFLYRARNDSKAEEKVLKQGVEIAKSLQDDSEELMYSWNLCNLLRKQSRFSEMQPYLQRRLDLSRQKYPGDNSNLIQPMRELASNQVQLKEYDAAENLFKDTLELAKKCNSAPGQIAQIQDEMARLLSARGKTDKAEDLRRQNTKLRERGIHYQIVVAKRQIEKGEILNAENLNSRRYFLPEGADGCPPYGYIKTKESAFGKQARHTIGKGSTITSSMFE